MENNEYAPALSIMPNTNSIIRIKWFIAFFRSKPKNKWCEHYLLNSKGQRCALGFLATSRRYAAAKRYELQNLLQYQTAPINNGFDPRYPQPHPKARILAALRDKLKEATNE